MRRPTLRGHCIKISGIIKVMSWKSLKRLLFQIIGPSTYRILHAFYFFLRIVAGILSRDYGSRFFGRDLLAFSARLKPGDRVLDIGAFLGGSTVLFGHAVGQRGQVMAFEPVHHRWLRGILFPFRLPQVNIMPLALAAEKGSAEFLIPIHNGVPLFSQAGFSESYPSEKMNPGYQFLKIPSQFIRLDDFMVSQGLDPESIAAVKIDVEGSEMSVFKGGEDFFQRFNGFVLCEFWFNEVPPLGWTWLRERGYTCSYLSKEDGWMSANTLDEMKMICSGETYGNFFLEKPMN
jgi:FkbM family methyltransferase